MTDVTESGLPPRRHHRVMKAHLVVRLHREHPDWTANMIGDAIDSRHEYVRATAKRHGLVLPYEERRGPKGIERGYEIIQWSPEMLAALRKGLDERFAIKTLASLIGVSPGCLMGKIKRLAVEALDKDLAHLSV